MTKIKHSKFKNTGVLFELLVRQITSDAINNTDNSVSVNLMREFFKGNTLLRKELKYYSMLKSEKMKSEVKANKFIDVILNEHKKINKSAIKREKYNLIKEIKKHYDVEKFFSTKISDYKLNASIYNLFEMNSKKFNSPKFIMNSRETIVEHIKNGKSEKLAKAPVIESYKKENEDIRLLTYNILLEKFNDKYNGLNSKQKTLLKEYINNVNNTGKLKSFIDKNVDAVVKNINKSLKFVDDKVVSVKLNEVAEQLKNIKSKKTVKDTHVLSIMRSYDLIKEVANVIKK
tara:strand:- start:135 stop:998 length:864 start_codon:yes stop_codon:yes gene_type:complete